MFVRGVLIAARVRMRNPDGRKAQFVRESVVRHRASKIGNNGGLPAGGGFNDIASPPHPGVRGIESCSRRNTWHMNAYAVESTGVEMLSKPAFDIFCIRRSAYNESQLQVRACHRRNRIDRLFRVTGL